MSLHLQTLQYHPQPKQKQSHVGSGNKVGCTSTNHSLDTLDLFDTKQSPPWLEFFHPESNQKRWEDQNLETMSKRSHGSNINNTTPKLDLKLNLSPPPPPPPARRSNGRQESPPQRSASVSPPSSCVSSEINGQEDHHHHSGGGLSPEATSMMLVGCPRCLMYVMLSEDDPKCPKCKSTVLLDFLHDNNSCSSSVSGSSKKTRMI